MQGLLGVTLYVLMMMPFLMGKCKIYYGQILIQMEISLLVGVTEEIVPQIPMTASEIWAAYRAQGVSNFESNFQITDQTVPYNNVLASAGNDFMNVRLEGTIVHTIWGDPRDGTILGLEKITSEARLEVVTYPNPTQDIVSFKSFSGLKEISVFDKNGKLIATNQVLEDTIEYGVDLSRYPSGIYYVELKFIESTITKKVIKN
jgi:hypothetical protein